MLLVSKTPALTYDDVLLVPGRSSVLPKDADTGVDLGESGIRLSIPILSSAMDTVTESAMAIAMARNGGMGVIHKNLSPDTQASEIRKVKDLGLPVAAAIGVSPQDYPIRSKLLHDSGVDVLCVDTAHGHSEMVLEAISALRKVYPKTFIIGGNIVTSRAAIDLFRAGANAVKVGVGPGSICTTRLVAGVGFPQLSAIDQVYEFTRTVGMVLIADGGIRYPGDVAKAIAAGADLVMLGSVLSGTDETPGDVIESPYPHKIYRGMGSEDAMIAGSSDRYFQDKTKKMVAEGVVSRVPAKGPVSSILHQYVGGLKASMGYTGCRTIGDMKGGVEFVQITNSGLAESKPHSVDVLGVGFR